jgi:hypothetical protein
MIIATHLLCYKRPVTITTRDLTRKSFNHEIGLNSVCSQQNTRNTRKQSITINVQLLSLLWVIQNFGNAQKDA